MSDFGWMAARCCHFVAACQSMTCQLSQMAWLSNNIFVGDAYREHFIFKASECPAGKPELHVVHVKHLSDCVPKQHSADLYNHIASMLLLGLSHTISRATETRCSCTVLFENAFVKHEALVCHCHKDKVWVSGSSAFSVAGHGCSCTWRWAGGLTADDEGPVWELRCEEDATGILRC